MGLDAVELVMELASAFNVSLHRVTITTVGALFDHILAQLPPDPVTLVRADPTAKLWERYLNVVERTTRIPRDKLQREASFRDLGLD